MGKGARIRRQHLLEEEQKKKVEALYNIIKSMELTRKEKLKKFYIKHLTRKADKVCRVIYGFKLSGERNKFKKRMRDVYAEGYVLQDFGSYHLLGITKCSIMDNNWNNYINSDGTVKLADRLDRLESEDK